MRRLENVLKQAYHSHSRRTEQDSYYFIDSDFHKYIEYLYEAEEERGFEYVFVTRKVTHKALSLIHQPQGRATKW